MVGRGERIRTSDILLPKQALYQAEPRPDRGPGYLVERKPAGNRGAVPAERLGRICGSDDDRQRRGRDDPATMALGAAASVGC